MHTESKHTQSRHTQSRHTQSEHTQSKHRERAHVETARPPLASVLVPAVLASIAALLGGCAADEVPLEGTFAGTAVAPLPSPPLPPGDLEIAAELRLDGETGDFELDMDLSSMGLTDAIDLRGTYVAANGAVTLMPSGFEIDPASGNGADGLCITLVGFAETVVCFAEVQDGEHDQDAVTLTLAHDIAGVAGTTTLPLTRTP